MSTCTIENKKQMIQFNLNLLKLSLQETGMAVAFDKDNDCFIFFDRQAYIDTKKFQNVFKVNFLELTY